MRLAMAVVILAFGLMMPGLAASQVLTLPEVQALDWSGSIQMALKGATDGVFDGGPDYYTLDPADPWLWESDIVHRFGTFTIQIYNNRNQPLTDLMVLAAFDVGTFGSLTIGGYAAAPADFYTPVCPPFNSGGGRPGDGEAALYNSAIGVAFYRLGLAVGPRDTVEVPVIVSGAEDGVRVHFDFYGLNGSTVVVSAAASQDVTWTNTSQTSATTPETWGRVKALYVR